MKTQKLKIIPGPYRVCSEKHDNGSLVIRSDPKGGGDVPGDLVVALVVGGGPEEYERNTAEILAAAPVMASRIAHLESVVREMCLFLRDAQFMQPAAQFERIAALSNVPDEPRG